MVSLKPHPINLSGRLINHLLIFTTIVSQLSVIYASVEKKNTHTHTHNPYEVTPGKKSLNITYAYCNDEK